MPPIISVPTCPNCCLTQRGRIASVVGVQVRTSSRSALRFKRREEWELVATRQARLPAGIEFRAPKLVSSGPHRDETRTRCLLSWPVPPFAIPHRS